MGKRRVSKSSGRGRAGSNADLELSLGDGLLGAEEMPGFSSPVNIFITHYRHRLADPQGPSTKAAIDAIVAAGILADDSAEEIREIRDRQKKIPKTEAEKTEFEIRRCNLGAPKGW